MTPGQLFRTSAALLLSVPFAHASQAVQTHFVNGLWFDGTKFVANDFYSVDGLLTHRAIAGKDPVTVDLHGGYVVPPYGDAHTHNFDGIYGTADFVALNLKDGIFYAQVMTDTTDGAREVVAAELVDTPSTVDVTYAHGGLTAINGHPKEIYEALASGFIYPKTEAQRQIVLASHRQEGKAYWEIDTPADLEAKWPKILAAKPDLIKIYLSESEHFTPDSHVHPELAKGLDPALVPLIAARAHAAGLKVAAHLATAADYHVAVTGGVDEMAHMPGYQLFAKDAPAVYRISDGDILLSVKKHITVQATAGIDIDDKTSPADLAALKAEEMENLKRLRAAGVPIVVGSDTYAEDAAHEADYLQSFGLWSNLEMLRMWSVTTPKDIFPKRKIAELRDGYEANFLVLKADPLAKWSAVHEIADRWKSGQRVVLRGNTR